MLKKIFHWGLWILRIWLIAHIVYITIDGLVDYRGQSCMAIVLGNKVEADSSLSPVLAGRVDRAIALYKDGKVSRIMVSGGTGTEDRPVPEGLAMRLYLEAHGIPRAAIIEDNKGENTYLTAKDFMAMNDSLHCENVIVVSSFYHITRTKYIFRKLGFKNVHSASSNEFFLADTWGTIREVPAFYKYMLVY